MGKYASSQRMDMVGSVINNLREKILADGLAHVCGLSDDQVDSMCTKAIKDVAEIYKVTESTVFSKCVREIGYKNKFDFVVDLVKQIGHASDNLYHALVRHKTEQDSEWDIERMLGLPFNHCFI